MLRTLLVTRLLVLVAAPSARAIDFPDRNKPFTKPEAFDKPGGILEPDLWSVRTVDPALTLADMRAGATR